MWLLNDNGNPCNSGYFVSWTKKGIAIDVLTFDSSLWEDIKTNSFF